MESKAVLYNELQSQRLHEQTDRADIGSVPHNATVLIDPGGGQIPHPQWCLPGDHRSLV